MSKKVLIIEDEPTIADLAKMILERAGFEIEICDNGREAIDMLRSFQPDAVLLDVMLPGMDGSAIANEMKNDAELNRIPIIVMSALSESRNLFRDVPQVRDFAAKPFSIQTLVEQVKKVTDAE
ncbi:two-component system [Parelusimicrobium proximum]|uniref:response regulator n=1 Tax=Parelusimicrobium proximum TaxID=3228953 RepID=UPI003D171C79